MPEVDTATDDEDLDLALEAHATEDIVGDVDGDDYRAGTLDPEGSDRGPRGELGPDAIRRASAALTNGGDRRDEGG